MNFGHTEFEVLMGQNTKDLEVQTRIQGVKMGYVYTESFYL